MEQQPQSVCTQITSKCFSFSDSSSVARLSLLFLCLLLHPLCSVCCMHTHASCVQFVSRSLARFTRRLHCCLSGNTLLCSGISTHQRHRIPMCNRRATRKTMCASLWPVCGCGFAFCVPMRSEVIFVLFHANPTEDK